MLINVDEVSFFAYFWLLGVGLSFPFSFFHPFPQGKLWFFHNGKNMGLAFNDLPSPISPVFGMQQSGYYDN